MKLLQLLIILIMASMIIPSVNALTVSQTRFTDGMTTTFADLEKTPYIDVAIAGMNTAVYKYVLTVYMGRGIPSYPPVLNGSFAQCYSGLVYIANVTVATTRVTFEPSDFPFEFTQENYAIVVQEMWKSNLTLKTTLMDVGSFNISGSDDPAIAYHFDFTNCLPKNLDLGASPYIGKGISLDLYALKAGITTGFYNYSVIPVEYFVTDNTSARNIIGYGSGSLYYTHRSSTSSPKFTYAYGFKPIHRVSPFPLEIDQGYYFYVGIRMGGVYNLTNSFVSCSDGSMFQLTFSANGITSANKVSELYGTYANKYDGACIYFETGIGNTHQAVSYSVGGLGLIIRNWGDSFGGVGFGSILAMLIAFMIAVIFLSIPFNISLRFHFKLPNYVYGAFIVLGVTADFGLGILELWQYAFFILCVALTVVVRFREEIGEYMSSEEGLLAKVKIPGLHPGLVKPKPVPVIADTGLLSKAKARKEFLRRKELLLRKPVGKRTLNGVARSFPEYEKVRANFLKNRAFKERAREISNQKEKETDVKKKLIVRKISNQKEKEADVKKKLIVRKVRV